MLVTDCLVTLGASGAAAQCGACSALESGVVHVSGRHNTPRAMARQQERAFLRLYVPPGRGMTVGMSPVVLRMVMAAHADRTTQVTEVAQHLGLYCTTLYLYVHGYGSL
jgi:hypothetical protein